MTNWLMIGTAPTVLCTLPIAHHLHPDAACVATSNGGLGIWPVPDVYLATDMLATKRFAQQARQAQDNGTRLVTLRRNNRSLKDRDSDWYDEFLELGRGLPSRAKWGEFTYTGPLLLEYLLRNGATKIILVGCDGYRHGDERDYWDGQTMERIPARTGQQRTIETLGPGFEVRARLFPEVPIIQYGDPAFQIDSPNWEVRRCPQPSS